MSVCRTCDFPAGADAEVLAYVLEQLKAAGIDQELEAVAVRMMADSRISRAEGTWRTYEPHLTRWFAFCSQAKAKRLGALGVVASLFLQLTFEDARTRGIGPQAVEKASAAISALHELVGAQSPCVGTQCDSVREVARRTLVGTRLDREPATADDIRLLVDTHLVEGVSLDTRMMVTCAALCFAGLLRYSDLARVMVHYDLMRFYGDRVELYLFASKTDQHWRGAFVPIGRVGGKYCPVHLLEELLRAGNYTQRPATRESVAADGTVCVEEVEDVGPLLRAVSAVNGGQRLRRQAVVLPELIEPIAYGTFSRKLKHLFKEAGVTKQIGTHSLRSGGASEAVANGADRAVVQKTGRWRSPNVFESCYVHESGAQKRRVTLCMGLGG